MNDQGGDANAVNVGKRAGFGVVIICALKTKRRRDITVVKLFDSAETAQVVGVVSIGKQSGLNPDTLSQTPQKILVINPVASFHEQFRSGAHVDRRRDGADGPYFPRWVFPIFTSQLQDHVAAQREAGDSDMRQT